jgi:uncharacterized protein (DUF2141 family)
MEMKRNSRTASSAIVLAVVAGLGLAMAAPAQVPVQGTQGAQAGQQQGQGRGGGRGGGQAPARDAQVPQVSGTGVITGVVTSGGGTGSPVRRARVTLSGPELRGGRSTVTNDLGQFTFSALPPGRFTMTASKAGYVDVPYGAKRPGRPGTPIQLAAGQKMENANILLPKGGVITGVVVDDSGEPAPGTQVRVLRYIMRTGEKTLQQAGQGQADDRGIYRIYGLQPGDYLVSAVPRNQGVGDLRNTIAAEIEVAMQQLQASGLAAGLGGRGGGGGGRGGGAGVDLGQLMAGRGGNQDLLGRVTQLQQQLAQTEQEQAVAYAPVYYPGTPSPSQSSPVTLTVSEERSGVDFRLMLVQTAKIEGTVQSQDGALPQNTQVSLVPTDQIGMPAIPGASPSMTRTAQDGRFVFNNVPPGQYRVMARANVRAVDPNQPADATGRGGRGGRGGEAFAQGGRGGPGQIAQVLWGSSDVSVSGQNIQGVTVALQPGMTVTGRVTFESSTLLPPSDLTRVRVNLTPRGSQQGMEMGGVPPGQVDASGRFTITGVPPGRYSISANAPAGVAPGMATAGGGAAGRAAGAGGAAVAAQWILKSAVAGPQDALDFGLVVEPNMQVAGATLLFVDRTQEVSGTIQDTLGKPTADYTIILFASDKGYWLPQARRIQSARPGTDGKFAFRNIPAGDYRLTAVTDVEPGEWFDPNFLSQLVSVSIPVTLREGEKKVQDIKVAGG